MSLVLQHARVIEDARGYSPVSAYLAVIDQHVTILLWSWRCAEIAELGRCGFDVTNFSSPIPSHGDAFFRRFAQRAVAL